MGHQMDPKRLENSKEEPEEEGSAPLAQWGLKASRPGET